MVQVEKVEKADRRRVVHRGAVTGRAGRIGRGPVRDRRQGKLFAFCPSDFRDPVEKVAKVANMSRPEYGRNTQEHNWRIREQSEATEEPE